MIAIIYSTGAGHTAALARLIAEAMAPLHEVKLIDVAGMNAADWQALDRAEAIVFGAPTYMGSVAAGFKEFMDESSDRWSQQRWADKLAAGFTIATYPSGDKLSSLTQLAVFAAQHGMVWVGARGIAPAGAGREAENWQGAWLGLMATSSRDKTVLIDTGDAAAARQFGARIAGFCARLR